MQCPICKVDKDRVVDSRVIREGNSIRRRRECLNCGRRFTTYERIEIAPRMVVKKDMRRESFNREKILSGMRTACEKLPVSQETLERLTAGIESHIFERFDTEVPSGEIGEAVSEALKAVHKVAYVRFASVYREFTDVRQFSSEALKLTISRVGTGDLRPAAPVTGG